eukprot:jgi/Psemu1/16965/gm1.16965_g
MTNLEKQNRKPVDDFQTVAMMQSIEEIKDHKKKETITKAIDYISAKKYIPRKNEAECIFEEMDGIHQIWMMMDKLNKGFYDLAEEDERWIDFKQHWNTRLKRLYQAVPSEELEDGTENTKGSCQQARKHKRAKEGDESVIAREWMEIARTLEKNKVGRYFHVHWICRLKGMNERVDQTAQNKRQFRASNWKQELKKDFEKLDMYDGIQKVTDPVNKNSTKSSLEYIENLKYTPVTNGAEHYFKFMENLFDTLKQIDGYVTPIELRMQVAATQFCNCENEGILMYMIHKNCVEKYISDDHRMMEQDWIDFKQHWNESLQDMYHEKKA